MTAVDTNVLLALWNADESGHHAAVDMLETAASRGRIVICGAVFGELLAGPNRTEKFINEFLYDAEISVDWASTEEVWRVAGLAFQTYAAGRRRQKADDPRRIPSDFYIGAHALCNGYSLLTLDNRMLRMAFPKLAIIRT